jgi:hypothetical protein
VTLSRTTSKPPVWISTAGTYAGSCGGIGMIDFAMGVFVRLAACARGA